MQNSILDTYINECLQGKTITAKRKRILEASINLFAKNGYSNTSTSEIAKVAGVAEGTIFKHFGTKENLLLSSIIPFITEYILPKLALNVEGSEIKDVYPDFRYFIHELVFERFSFIEENYKIAHILFAEILYRENLRTEIINILSASIIDNFSVVLNYFKKEKLIKDLPNELIIRTIISNLWGYIFMKYVFNPNKEYNNIEELKYIEEFIVNAFSLQ